MDARCVVQNAGTASAVACAVIGGLPLIERIATVTGRVVKKPGNWKLRIGTPVIEAIRLAEGVTEEPGKLILGGPMMEFLRPLLTYLLRKAPAVYYCFHENRRSITPAATVSAADVVCRAVPCGFCPVRSLRRLKVTGSIWLRNSM